MKRRGWGSYKMAVNRIFATPARWQLDYLFDLGFAGWIVHIGVVSLTGAVLVASQGAQLWIVLWLAAMLALSASLSFISYRYTRGAPRDDAVALFGWLHSILTGVVGLVWGLGALGAADGDFQTLLIYSLALGGTVLGAVSSQHAVPRSCMLSIATSVSLLAAAHVIHDTGIYGLLNGGMILLYAAITSLLSIRMYRFLLSNRALNVQLDEKVMELTRLTRELETARLAAEEANASKSRFLAQASHDLRQPIHGIGLFAACLRDARLTTDERRMLSAIEQSLESVARLFGSLLDISRLDSEGMVCNPEPVSVGRLLRDVATQLHGLAETRNVTVSVIDTRLWVMSDPALLAPLVLNLVSNGIKYGSDRVVLGIRRDGGRIAIAIRDNGDGIPDMEMENIFDEFYRLDSSAGIEGLGLGLSIVRRLANLLGLNVDFRSEPHRGTSVFLRGLEITDAVISKPPAPSTRHPLSGARVCVIDDDDGVLMATTRLLDRWGCQVKPFLEAPDGCDCDIIICDFQLGGSRTGPQVVADLRARAGRDMPALIISGDLHAEARAACERTGLPFLAKPVMPAELRATLTGLIMEHARGRPARRD